MKVEVEVKFKDSHKWVAMDYCGLFCSFKSKPQIYQDQGVFEPVDIGDYKEIGELNSFFKDSTTHWSESLMTVSDFKDKYGVK